VSTVDDLQVLNVAVSVFSLFCAVVLALVVKLYRRAAREHPRGAPAVPRKPPAFVKYVWVIAIPIVGLIGWAQLHVQQRDAHFRQLVALPTTKTLFLRGATQLQLEADEVRRALTLLDQADHVGAHHLHPLDPVTFQLGDTRYSLGRDSAEANELWLTQVDPPPTLGDPTLGRLRSAELSAWFATVEQRLK